MITFDLDGGKFNFRTVGAIVHNGNVLLHRGEQDGFWTLPGGRVEFGEDTATALVREMQEELGIEVEINRMLWMVENFFEYENRSCHEIATYFALDLPAECHLYERTDEWEVREGNCTILFRWFALDELADVAIYPTFLKQGLLSPPAQVQHIVHRDVK